MVRKELAKHKQENDFQKFYEKLEAFVPELKRFMDGSLKAAERQGMLDVGYYNAEGMLHEVYMETFQHFPDRMDIQDLRRSLFKKAIQKMDEKRMQEVPDEVNTHALLKAELKLLKEDFTTDAEGDLILNTELDDISYAQKQGWSPQIYLDEAFERLMVQKLELHEESLLSDEKRRLLGFLYATIPPRSKLVVELFVFGNTDTTDISGILEVPEDVIERIIFKVKERFKLL